jgi:hypothetical protein
MNKLLIPNPSRGIDFGWEILEFLLGATGITGGLHDVVQNLMRTYGDNFIVYGCTVVGSNVSAGLVMLNGELLVVDAHTKTNDYFVKVTTNETTWTIQDLDGNTQNILKKNRATLSGASGSLIYTGATLGERILIKTGYGIKRLAIGNWNMDATATINVAHGMTIAELTNVISAEAMIIADGGGSVWPLIHYNLNDNLIDGGITILDPTNVGLYRRTGGHFDSVNFDTAVFNRGYVNIIYQL